MRIWVSDHVYFDSDEFSFYFVDENDEADRISEETVHVLILGELNMNFKQLKINMINKP
jgi:hypothetical protein